MDQEFPAPSIPLTPVPAEASHRPKFLIPLLIVLLFIASAALAVYAWSLKVRLESLESSAPPGKEEGPSTQLGPSTRDEMVSWKVYENIDYGFSFKYPNDFPDPKIEKTSYELLPPGLNERLSVSFEIEGLLDPLDRRASGVDILFKRYDIRDTVESLAYEGARWKINHSIEKSSINSKTDGLYSGSIPSSIGFRSKQYQIGTIDGKKYRVSYDRFEPAGTYSKIAEIYFGSGSLVILNVGADLASPSEGFVATPFTTKPTGEPRLDKLFKYFDQILSTFKFLDGEEVTLKNLEFTAKGEKVSSESRGCFVGDGTVSRTVYDGMYSVRAIFSDGTRQEVDFGKKIFAEGMPWQKKFYPLELGGDNRWQVFYFLQYQSCGSDVAYFVRVDPRSSRLEKVYLEQVDGGRSDFLSVNAGDIPLTISAEGILVNNLHLEGAGEYVMTRWRWRDQTGNFEEIR